VFYALFGIPLGKLADRWTRTRLLAIGLAVWSAMTALSGLSRNFTQLGLARIGVGVGEASAGPSAYSLLSDYFRRGCAPRSRSIRGHLPGWRRFAVHRQFHRQCLEQWLRAGRASVRTGRLAGRVPGRGPAGLLLAGWVNSLREPAQPLRSAGAPPRVAGRVPVQGVRDLGTIVPPFTLIAAARGREALTANIAAARSSRRFRPARRCWAIRCSGSRWAWAAMPSSRGRRAWGATRPLSPRSGNRLHAGRDHRYGLISFVSYANSAFGPSAIRTFHAVPTKWRSWSADWRRRRRRQGDRRRRDGGPPEPATTTPGACWW
jgi:hypothetical protein